ncbi:DUF883 family protein [Candidatus Pacearchaeota archaeon]|nr:DUF883 family protein [Candidatus Pacearchaeota archaeon]
MAEKKKMKNIDTRSDRVINSVKNRARDVYDLGRSKAKDTYDLGRTKVIYAKTKTEDQIKEHPLESVLIAAGVGALVGAAVALVLSSKTQR